LHQAVDAGNSRSMRYVVQADGSRFLAEMGIFARGKGLDGQPTHFLVLLRDVSESPVTLVV
jgi:hypothetical protein